MAKELQGRGLAVLTVNGGDSAATVRKFFSEQHLSLPVVLDAGEVARKYGVQAIPTNYVIGANGKILGAFEGFDEDGIRKALAKAGVR